MTASAVFVIDDSVAVREVISIAFRRQNMNVCAFDAGEPACRQMETTVPDLVISDINMPGQDGFAVCEFVKQHPRLHQTPVILISGMVDKAIADRAFEVKADELMRKPFQPQDLVDRAKQLIGRRRLVVMPSPAAQPVAQPAAQPIAQVAAQSATRPIAQAAAQPIAQPAAQAQVAAPAHPAMHAPSFAEPKGDPIYGGAPARSAPPAYQPAPSEDAPFNISTASEQDLRKEVVRLQNLALALREELRQSKENLALLAERVMNNRD